MIRVLLYGDIDLNLIDGSAIWLASVAEVLGGLPDVSVTVLQKTRLNRDIVIRGAAAIPSVSLLDPWKCAASDPEVAAAVTQNGGPRLSPESAARLIIFCDRQSRFDFFLIRSLELASLLLHQPSFASRLWVYVTDPMRHTESPHERSGFCRILEQCGRIICQTEEAKSAILTQFNFVDAEKVFVLSPMIPSIASNPHPSPDPLAPRLGYFGKLSPPYMILEMLDAFDRIRERIPGAEFHMVGDKFHNAPPVEGFIETVKRRLTTTPGVIWHGGVSRDEANAILARVHVASSWRSSAFDDSLELSTKVLEYAALGLPVLMNPSTVQRRIFGDDYPAYVTSQSEFVDKFVELTGSPALYERVAASVRSTADNFTFDSNRRRLLPLFHRPKRDAHQHVQPRTILWAGHDFKFIRRIQESVERNDGYQRLMDHYEGHVIQDTDRSGRLLADADLVFCEWCLGNAEWYSKHKRPGQRLVVRLHHQELQLPYLDRVHWNQVDRVIFICPRNMRLFLERFPFLESKSTLIYNSVDCESFALSKLPTTEFNLGLLGIAPKRKSPHLAVEILAKLKQLDSRYVLFIKGNKPKNYRWLWQQREERQYYEALFDEIDASPYANSIVFEPPGDDVAEWFTRIGYILSPSEHEGSHQAVAEGMAAGAIPLIRNWAGAEELYPKKYVFADVPEAVELLQTFRKPEVYEAESDYCRQWAQRFDLKIISEEYSRLFGELLSGSRFPRQAARNRIASTT